MPLRKLTNLDLECMEHDAVSTITLVSGWDSNSNNTLKFQCAVSTVMKLNPVLTGKLVKSSSGVQVETGVFDVSDVFQVIQFPPKKSFAVPVSVAEKLKLLQELALEFNPKIKTGTTLLKNKSNIFEVGLMVLPSGCTCYKVSISHAVADASTHYNVMQQLSDIWNGREPSILLDWTPIPEIYPCQRPLSDLSVSDKARLFVSLFCLLFHNWLERQRKGKRTMKCALVNSDICFKEKSEANDGTCKFLSTNDVVTAALSSVSKAKTLVMAADLRKRQGQHSKLNQCTAGNYIKGIFIMDGGSNPCTIRKEVLRRQTWCDKPKHGLLQMHLRSFCLVTNWASFMTCIVGRGLEVVAHMPLIACEEVPHDAAVIFKLDMSGTLAVWHNMSTVLDKPIFSP